MFSRLLILTGFVAILVVPSTATAQGTFTWNFGTVSGNPAPSSSTGSGATAGSFSIANSFGAVATPLTNVNPSGNAGASGAFNLGNAVNDTFTTFNAAAPYYQVTLTDSGTGGLQLNNFTFNFRRETTGARNYALRASTDNFGSDLLAGAVNTLNTWLPETNGTGDVNLGTGTVTLRLFVFNGSGAAASGVINSQIDDVIISYTPVPEPATMFCLSALGLGAVGLVRRIRRTAVVVS